MYTLRVIIEERENSNSPYEQVIHNYDLGNSYTKISNGSKLFYEIIDRLYPEFPKDDVVSIICSEKQDEWFVMNNSENKKRFYFIMTENGSTFEKLSN